jgi:hypothetical protein
MDRHLIPVRWNGEDQFCVVVNLSEDSDVNVFDRLQLYGAELRDIEQQLKEDTDDEYDADDFMLRLEDAGYMCVEEPVLVYDMGE